MSVQKEYEKKFEIEEYEILILVEAPCSGAECIGNMLVPSVDFLASIDLRTGQLFHEKGRLEWIIEKEDNHNGWGREFKKYGIYRITVRKGIPQEIKKDIHPDLIPYLLPHAFNKYLLIDIVEENVLNGKLQELKEHYAKPVSIENEVGTFVLNREFSWFEGAINWNGEDAIAYLETDVGSDDTARLAMKVLKKIMNNLAGYDAEYRAFAAQKLTSLANEWMEDAGLEDVKEITEDAFAKRMGIREIRISPSKEVSVFYDDDNMFWGHAIEIMIGSDGKIISADI